MKVLNIHYTKTGMTVPDEKSVSCVKSLIDLLEDGATLNLPTAAMYYAACVLCVKFDYFEIGTVQILDGPVVSYDDRYLSPSIMIDKLLDILVMGDCCEVDSLEDLL